MLVPPFTRSPLRHRQARDAKPLPPVFLVAGRGNDVAENLRGTLEGADPTRWSFRSRRWDNLGDRLAKAGDESGLSALSRNNRQKVHAQSRVTLAKLLIYRACTMASPLRLVSNGRQREDRPNEVAEGDKFRSSNTGAGGRGVLAAAGSAGVR